MVPQAAASTSTRLNPPLSQHYRHVQSRCRDHHGPPHRQRRRQRQVRRRCDRRRCLPSQVAASPPCALFATSACRTRPRQALAVLQAWSCAGRWIRRRRREAASCSGWGPTSGPAPPCLHLDTHPYFFRRCQMCHSHTSMAIFALLPLPRPSPSSVRLVSILSCCTICRGRPPHFYLFPLLGFAHIPIQTLLDFNAVFILID